MVIELLLGLMFFQETTTSTGSQALADTQRVVDIVSKIITSAAVVIGGIWAYYRFGKERPYEANLELTVSGEATRKDGTIYLRTVANATNIGSAKWGLFHPLTALRVLTCEHTTDVEKCKEVDWVHLETWRLFADQEHLEPNEPTVDAHLIQVLEEKEYAALKLEVYVTSSEKEAEGLENMDSWVATSIINLVSDNDIIGKRNSVKGGRQWSLSRVLDSIRG